jgi:hypothetical protein
MGKIATRFAKKRNRVKTPVCRAAYWGYHPRPVQPRTVSEIHDFMSGRRIKEAREDQGCFEFSTAHMRHAGWPKKVVQEITQEFVRVVQTQLQEYYQITPKEKQDFLDQEQDRLQAVIQDFDTNGRYGRNVEDMLRLNIIACCAISTLVAGGRITQDQYNGDQFMWEHFSL